MWMRSEWFRAAGQRGGARLVGAHVVMAYITQCVTMAFFFALGRGIQAIV